MLTTKNTDVLIVYNGYIGMHWYASVHIGLRTRFVVYEKNSFRFGYRCETKYFASLRSQKITIRLWLGTIMPDPTDNIGQLFDTLVVCVCTLSSGEWHFWIRIRKVRIFVVFCQYS